MFFVVSVCVRVVRRISVFFVCGFVRYVFCCVVLYPLCVFCLVIYNCALYLYYSLFVLCAGYRSVCMCFSINMGTTSQ